MSKNSIVEQALLQLENLEDAIKQNAKGIISSTMKNELKDLLKNQINEQEDENPEDEEDMPADDGNDSDVSSKNVDDDSSDKTDMPSDDDDMTSDDDMSTDDEDMDMPSDDEDMASDDDMSTDDEDMDMPSDDEDMNSDDEDVLDMTNSSDDEVVKVFKAMGPNDGVIVKKSGDKLDLTIDGEDYIINLDDIEDSSDMEDIDEMDEVDEMSDSEDIKEYQESSDESTDEETVYEIELDEDDDEEEGSVKRMETKEAARTKWNPHGNKGTAKRAGIASKKMFAAGSKSINEHYEKLKKQNAEYKKALVLFKDKLNEVAVFNANLAYATRLFTEHTTTKNEKVNILKRFDSVNTLKESKSLYSVIKSELETKKPVTESIANKIINTKTSSSQKEVLAESKAYINPQFSRIKDLIQKIK